MKIKHHIIYLPGLSDDKLGPIQAKLINSWKIYGVTPHYFSMQWSDGESFNLKLRRLIKEIDRHKEAGGQVTLFGTSAGTSTAINAYVERKDMVYKLVSVCGKIQNLQKTPEFRYRQNPALRGSFEMLPHSLAKLNEIDARKILSIKPLRDGVVPPKDTYIEGARLKTIPTFGHAFSIFYSLTLGSYRIIRFIKKSTN